MNCTLQFAINGGEKRKVTIVAAEVEYENYCKHKRPCTGSQFGGSVIYGRQLLFEIEEK